MQANTVAHLALLLIYLDTSTRKFLDHRHADEYRTVVHLALFTAKSQFLLRIILLILRKKLLVLRKKLLVLRKFLVSQNGLLFGHYLF